ncbi:MAG: hypothetical protein JW745_00780 [Sedimentisphaerales bacterium]|nr:hypothetical protein [Sedimentisphaerales bacterium]MBN2843119.1 hypothetical protein [Sedimentisphaerales bacterium]
MVTLKKYLFMTCAMLAGSLAMQAHGELVAYEGFDMPLQADASITGSSGATSFGWIDGWRHIDGPGTVKFVTESLDAGIPNSIGGSIMYDNGNCRENRTLNKIYGSVNETIYVSFIANLGDDNNVEFNLGGDWNSNTRGGIGCDDNTQVMLNVKEGSNNNKQIIAAPGVTRLYVLKMEFGDASDTVSVYVDPAPYSAEPATPTATQTVSSFSFDRFKVSRYNSSNIMLVDEIRIATTYAEAIAVVNAPEAVSPLHNATNVATDATLNWTDTLPSAAGYYVYFGSTSVTEPNELELAPKLVSTTPFSAGTTSYTPTLGNDMICQWQVEKAFTDDGLVNEAGDPNNVKGMIYSFETVKTIPTINADLPQYFRVNPGENVNLTLDAINVETYQWYVSADMVVGDDTAIGTNSNTFTINNVQAANDGYYYCVVSKSGTPSSTSTMCKLAVNRMLAWYKFENNLNDSAGINSAVFTSTGALVEMPYDTGIINADNQAYAAIPDGSVYGMTTTSAYPKAGWGNGLESFTYSAWVKCGEGQTGGHLFGVLNVGSTTGVRLTINNNGDVSFYLREETGSAIIADVNIVDVNVLDGQWHHVAVTLGNGQFRLFFDGVVVNSQNQTRTNFVDWAFPMPILAINSRGIFDRAFSGSVDDLRIYNYPKAMEDIAQEYYDATGIAVCLYGKPQYDLSGNCIVDIADFAIIANDWMDNGLYPIQ